MHALVGVAIGVGVIILLALIIIFIEQIVQVIATVWALAIAVALIGCYFIGLISSIRMVVQAVQTDDTQLGIGGGLLLATLGAVGLLIIGMFVGIIGDR